VSLKNSFIYASIGLIASFLYLLNTFSSNSLWNASFLEDNRLIYLIAAFLNIGLTAFLISLTLVFVWGSGESLTREI
jgi:hypothetical protein